MKELTKAWKNNNISHLTGFLSSLTIKDCGKVISFVENRLPKFLEGQNLEFLPILVNWIEKNSPNHQGKWNQFCKDTMIGKYKNINEIPLNYVEVCIALNYKKYYPYVSIALIDDKNSWLKFTQNVYEKLPDNLKRSYLENSLLYSNANTIETVEGYFGANKIKEFMQETQSSWNNKFFWTTNSHLNLPFKDEQILWILKNSERFGNPIDENHNLVDFVLAKYPKTLNYMLNKFSAEILEKKVLPVLKEKLKKTNNSFSVYEEIKESYDYLKVFLHHEKLKNQLTEKQTKTIKVKI